MLYTNNQNNYIKNYELPMGLYTSLNHENRRFHLENLFKNTTATIPFVKYTRNAFHLFVNYTKRFFYHSAIDYL